MFRPLEVCLQVVYIYIYPMVQLNKKSDQLQDVCVNHLTQRGGWLLLQSLL